MKFGDRVTYKKKGITYIDLVKSETSFSYYYQDDIEILKIERPKYEVVEEKKELLTEEEREFLKLFIKLNFYKIKWVKKFNDYIYFFKDDSNEPIVKFNYSIDSFRGLSSSNEVYTLSELGLEE